MNRIFVPFISILMFLFLDHHPLVLTRQRELPFFRSKRFSSKEGFSARGKRRTHPSYERALLARQRPFSFFLGFPIRVSFSMSPTIIPGMTGGARFELPCKFSFPPLTFGKVRLPVEM